MSKRTEEIRKRITKRQEEQYKQPFEFDLQEYEYNYVEDNKKKAGNKIYHYMVKMLFSVALVLIVGIVYKSDGTGDFVVLRNAFNSVFNQEFQFTAVRQWLEGRFGSSVAFINNKTLVAGGDKNLAVPASGRVLQGFNVTGQGVTVEMKSGEIVEAINEGTVVFIGEKPNFQYTVVIQHPDNTESWYGNLDKVDVQLYDAVKAKQKIGTAKVDVQSGKTELFFAFKKNEKFIDPIQVIPFE